MTYLGLTSPGIGEGPVDDSRTSRQLSTGLPKTVGSPRFPNGSQKKHPGKSNIDQRENDVNNQQDVYRQWEDKQRAMGRPHQVPIVPIPEIYCKGVEDDRPSNHTD